MVFLVGYRTLKMQPRFKISRSMGVRVVMRHKDRVLAVRHSYRPVYDFPSGVGRRKQFRDTAVRKLAEGLSIHTDPDALVYKQRHHRSHLFELTFD